MVLEITESNEQQLNARAEMSGKPSKPLDLEIAFSSENNVFLKWNPPATDGGSPVTKYFVEVLDKVGDWRTEKVVPSNQEITSIRNLEPGRVYQFRVSAVNEAGAGEPSNVTPFTVAKPKGCAPKIHNDTLHTVEMEVGDSFAVQRLIDAEPSAFVTWQLDGRTITNQDRVRIIYEKCCARIEIHKCKKNDSGIYSITAKNEFGRLEQKIFKLVVEDGVFRKLGKAALITAGASAAILGGIPLVVSGLGFTAGGVAAGSMAAAYQSAVLGGTIASGSAFATLQSIGAAGLAASTQAGIVGATGATSLAAVFNKKKPKK
ncbi:myomesin-1-like [Uloborus diversus]|uniref:myomesin-1-like n=1 Tax=Uloborus diversus TaxID=327109 RepID=UPI00240A2BA3|nr:myomesin-1-like [Uloborus diversus]